mgnify:CR=1 FL=1
MPIREKPTLRQLLENFLFSTIFAYLFLFGHYNPTLTGRMTAIKISKYTTTSVAIKVPYSDPEWGRDAGETADQSLN